MPKTHFAGLLVPAVTPIDENFEVDHGTFAAICRWLLDQGAHGLAVFGTTSEANSLPVKARREALDRLLQSGFRGDQLLPGTGMSALADTVELTRHAVSNGCGGVLALPPFYYKPVDDEGLFRFYAEVIERVGSSDLGLWLYHIPQNTGVPITHALIARLRERYPETVLGIKDSSGDWANTEALLTRHPGLRVFPSSEGVLLKALRLGAAGCISATGNVNPAGIRAVYDGWQGADADRLQSSAAEIRTIVSSYTLVPAVKAVLAAQLDLPALNRPLLPLMPLAEEQNAELLSRLAAVGHRLAPLKAAA